MNKLKYSVKPYSTLKSYIAILVLISFGVLFTSCDAPQLPPVPQTPPQEIVEDTVAQEENVVVLSDDQNIVQIGEARFFEDSIEVLGEGYSFSKRVSYDRVLILFDRDGKIVKVETLEALPFKEIDKNTIYILKGANLTMVSRHFGIPIEQLINCNPKIKNPNKIPALTRLKLNCQ